jgi:hypothetical protein
MRAPVTPFHYLEGITVQRLNPFCCESWPDHRATVNESRAFLLDRRIAVEGIQRSRRALPAVPIRTLACCRPE